LKPDWAADAACRGMTDMFFAERGDSGTIKRAKAVCAGCPVRDECLEYGLHERFGIWGGLAPKERREPKRARAAIAACGTDSGYFRHRRLGQTPCDACKAAHTAVSVTNDKKARQQRRRAS
jgi:WhiB family redox-sensing transcriptional regulator